MKMASSKTLTDFFQPAKRLKPSSPPSPVSSSQTLTLPANPLTSTTSSISPAALTPEQQSRIQLNQSLAKSKRNLKTCLHRVTNSMKTAHDGSLGVLKLEEMLVEETWLDALPGEFQKPYAEKLGNFLNGELQSSCPIYPPSHLIFNALNSTPFDNVKAVIIGQVFLLLHSLEMFIVAPFGKPKTAHFLYNSVCNAAFE